jgi:glyoxylase-like metal-dependent hydrolase (beta-lactamase superfamily II)
MESCSSSCLEVQQVVTGPGTNCYLLYDPESRDAAIIDVAGQIDALLATVRSKGLNLRYFLFTHGHFDHLIGLPAIRDSFPEALVCMHSLGFEDMQDRRDWVINHFGEETIAEWMLDPELSKLLTFDVKTFKEPDMFLQDGQSLEFGERVIRVLHCPGHSRGGLCYLVDAFLFTGDVLFKGSVGRVDLYKSSRDDQISSVRRLYRELSDDIIVYPGHGESTTIGVERVENERVSETSIDL